VKIMQFLVGIDPTQYKQQHIAEYTMLHIPVHLVF